MMAEIHDVTLDNNESLRQRIIAKLTENKLPVNDPDALFAIKSFLDASDRSALSRMKLKQDKEDGDNAKEQARLIAEALRRASARALNLPEVRELDHDIPLTNPVEGEMEVGTVNETYDDFMSSRDI